MRHLMTRIKAFVAKHFTNLFVKHKKRNLKFCAGWCFQNCFKNVSTNLLDLSWKFLLFATYILPDMETGPKHDNSTALCYKCVIMRVCVCVCVCCFRLRKHCMGGSTISKKVFKKLSRVGICLERPLGLQP